jgi:hypothetical protein
MDAKAYADAMLAQLLAQARKQFGDAIKGFWFYDRDLCPGCGFPIDGFKHQGQDALSLNTFVYRPSGMLIGYFLCSLCAQQIIQATERNPGVKLPLHDVIERNLIAAYHRYLASQDA